MTRFHKIVYNDAEVSNVADDNNNMHILHGIGNRTDSSPFVPNCLSEEPLHVNGCGHYVVRQNDITTYRKAGDRVDWQLLYVWRGAMIVLDEQNQEIGRMQAGQMYLYPPKVFEKYIYKADKSRESEIFWIHFTGTEVETLLQHYNLLAADVFSVGKSAEIVDLYNKIFQEITLKTPFYNTLISDFFRVLLTLTARKKVQYGKNVEKSHYEILAPVIEELNANYASDKTVGEYAKMAHLDKYYFITIFKKSMGLSPLAYRTKIRMDNAKTLLQSTNMRIKEIALVNGYKDQLYFSRIFKKYTNLSPQEYRDSHR